MESHPKKQSPPMGSYFPSAEAERSLAGAHDNKVAEKCTPDSEGGERSGNQKFDVLRCLTIWGERISAVPRRFLGGIFESAGCPSRAGSLGDRISILGQKRK